jgi:hypothetical protein
MNLITQLSLGNNFLIQFRNLYTSKNKGAADNWNYQLDNSDNFKPFDKLGSQFNKM